MQLAKLPTSKGLVVKRGLTLLLQGQGTAKLFTRLYNKLPPKLKQPFANFFGGTPISHIIKDNETLNSSNTSKLIEILASRRISVGASGYPDLWHKIGKGLKYIKEKYLCQVTDINDEISHQVKSQISLRFWGYLSSRFETIYVSFIEAGLGKHVHHWLQHQSQHGAGTAELKMVEATGFLKPTPLTLKSAVGLSALYMVILQSLILMVWAISWIYVGRGKRLTNNSIRSTNVLSLAEPLNQPETDES